MRISSATTGSGTSLRQHSIATPLTLKLSSASALTEGRPPLARPGLSAAPGIDEVECEGYGRADDPSQRVPREVRSPRVQVIAEGSTAEGGRMIRVLVLGYGALVPGQPPAASAADAWSGCRGSGPGQQPRGGVGASRLPGPWLGARPLPAGLGGYRDPAPSPLRAGSGLPGAPAATSSSRSRWRCMPPRLRTWSAWPSGLDRLLVVGLQRRYEGTAAVFRRLAGEGRLGAIRLVHGLFAHRFAGEWMQGWRSDPARAGAGIIDDSACT